MVIEQVFVSTVPQQELLRRAEDLLATQGFGAVSGTVPGGDEAPRSVEMRRGGRKQPRCALELLQSVRIEYDRGRVTVAASTSSGGVGGSSLSFRLTYYRPLGGNDRELQQALLTALTRMVESAARPEADPQGALADLFAAEVAIREDLRERRKRHVALIVIAVVMLIVLMFMSALAIMVTR